MMQLEWNFVQLFTSQSITYVQEVAVEALDFSTRTLRVTKVRNGEEESLEYCELLVQISSSRQIRAIIYRTPHFKDHRDIAEAKRRRRKTERRRKTRLPEDLETFKRLKNHVTYISTKARRISYVDFMSENGGDQGRLFMATSALLPPKDDLCFPEYVDDATLAYEIGRFFHRKIINIRTDLDAAS